MHYTVYKITNLINNKIYIGSHVAKSLNDDYMGSGKNIKSAIQKYGIENFSKEVLFNFNSKEEMFSKEAELVNEDFVKRSDTYNAKCGGYGGFDHWNGTEKQREISKKALENFRNSLDTEEKKNLHIQKIQNGLKRNNVNLATFKGKKHTEETKLKIGLANSKNTGSKNSQFGTMWINNGVVNKKIKKEEQIPLGFYKGRI